MNGRSVAGSALLYSVTAVTLLFIAAPLALAINITGATIVPVGGGLSNVPKLLAKLDVAVRARILRSGVS